MAAAPHAPASGGSARDAVTPEDAERAVHALAQLPDAVRLSLGCGAAGDAERLRLLARAYGIEERLSVAAGGGGGLEWAGAGTPGGGGRFADLVEGLWPEGAGASSTARDDSLLAGQRIAIVTNLPAPYRVSLFAGVGRRAAAAGGELRVFFLGSRASGRSWFRDAGALEFGHEFVRSVELPVRRRRRPFAPLDLGARLRRFGPTVLVAPGFSPPGSYAVARRAARSGAPFGLWSGEIAATAERRGRLGRAHRGRLARRAAFGIAYGSLAREYLRSLAPELPVVHARNSAPAAAGRARPGAAGSVELVAVADLSLPGKGIETLVDALALAPELDCRLTVIGGDPSRSELPARAAGDARVRFTGAVAPAEVRAAFGRSHVFLFPSRIDVFGLALVEAMSAGLACVASPASGAVADLCASGVNSLVVEDDDPPGWARAIAGLCADAERRGALGEAAARTIERRWSVEHSVEAMVAGLRLGVLRSEVSR